MDNICLGHTDSTEIRDGKSTWSVKREMEMNHAPAFIISIRNLFRWPPRGDIKYLIF
jgi:hypothetical protein